MKQTVKDIFLSKQTRDWLKSVSNTMADNDADEQESVLQNILKNVEAIKHFCEQAYNYYEHDLGDWIDVKGLEKKLGIHPRTQAVWRQQGDLGYSKINGKIWYSIKNVSEMLKRKFKTEVKI